MQEDLFGSCPYVTAQKLLTGKWTLLIMYHLSIKTMRFNELQRALPNLTQATLTKHLRMMEENGLIIRTVYNQIPPRVEYSLSELGDHFKPVLDALQVWGIEYIDYYRSELFRLRLTFCSFFYWFAEKIHSPRSKCCKYIDILISPINPLLYVTSN